MEHSIIMLCCAMHDQRPICPNYLKRLSCTLAYWTKVLALNIGIEYHQHLESRLLHDNHYLLRLRLWIWIYIIT